MPIVRQLPRWAWVGGGALAFIAGMVNAAGYMGFRHQAITNLTGSSSLLGISLGTGDGAEALHWMLSIGAFVAGAIISGMIVQIPLALLVMPTLYRLFLRKKYLAQQTSGS